MEEEIYEGFPYFAKQDILIFIVYYKIQTHFGLCHLFYCELRFVCNTKHIVRTYVKLGEAFVHDLCGQWRSSKVDITNECLRSSKVDITNECLVHTIPN